ncbi:MAG: hypothetical protein OER95_14870 [Acidimicrobiia bacterium]|nr:hypothetical protein [Acidimicrobiia bacterium]
MFGPRGGRLPSFILILIAVGFGFLLAGGGAGSALGALFLLPFLALKMMVMFFLLTMMFRFVAGGRGPHWAAARHHGPWSGPTSDPSDSTTADQAAGSDSDNEDDKDWEEALRAAKREIDKLFPNPRE